jgi:NAD(P)-dependent dehydrogenase (short-subunit alcohol dehydrogenase family)
MTRAVIVTGGSAGIGSAIVELLAERGYDVGFTYRTRADAARAICERAPTRVEALQADFAEPEAAAAAVHELAEALGGSLHGLVNNAGINRRAPLARLTLDSLHEVVDVNLAAPLLAARAAVEHMPHGGRIVNVTSVLATEPLAGAAAYCASKAGLALASAVLALELAERGITVNCVAPGHTATPMNFGDRAVDAHSTRRSAIPAGRPAAPREIAAAVAYFLSCDAAYTTGASLLVDGGLALNSGPQSLESSPGFLENE